jgi:hypothetical protein
MWYTLAQEKKPKLKDNGFVIEDFSDRNIVNAQIRALEDISDLLRYCSQLVYQTQRGARGVVAKIRSNKKVSSFPIVIEILDQADSIALDSPARFADLCKSAAFELDQKVKKLIKLRNDFSHGLLDPSKPKKGLY